MEPTLSTFSIIMSVCDDACLIEENLPAFLEQEYEPGYEVIVVDESSTDNTADVLKLQKNEHPNLYTTFLPRPNRLVNRPRLALTLGVKAAKNDWVVFTDISTPPPSSQWLAELSALTMPGGSSARPSGARPTATKGAGCAICGASTTSWLYTVPTVMRP